MKPTIKNTEEGVAIILHPADMISMHDMAHHTFLVMDENSDTQAFAKQLLLAIKEHFNPLLKLSNKEK